MADVQAKLKPARGTVPNLAKLEGWEIGYTPGTRQLWIKHPSGAFVHWDGALNHLVIDSTGGLRFGGKAGDVEERVFTPAAGLSLGGKPDLILPHVFAPHAGLSLGGAAALARERVLVTVGGLLLGGQAARGEERVLVTHGGLHVGGQALVTRERVLDVGAGPQLGGKAARAVERAFLPAAGLYLGGQATVTHDAGTPPPEGPFIDYIDTDFGSGTFTVDGASYFTIRIHWSEPITFDGASGYATLTLNNGDSCQCYTTLTGVTEMDFQFIPSTPNPGTALDCSGADLALTDATIVAYGDGMGGGDAGTPAVLNVPIWPSSRSLENSGVIYLV